MERLTKQRKIILEYLQSVTSHPTAEQVYEGVKKKLPKISLGTVYRNLQNMSEEGEILKLEINGEFHFDACKKSHQHLVCKKCGKIIDVFDESLEKNILKKTKNKDFTPEKTYVYIQGICSDCKNKKIMR